MGDSDEYETVMMSVGPIKAVESTDNTLFLESARRSIQQNVRTKIDNTTTARIPGPILVQDERRQIRPDYVPAKTRRGNLNHLMEMQSNLKATPAPGRSLAFLDGSRTTTKETTNFGWNGHAHANINNTLVTSTFKDGTTKLPANKQTISWVNPAGLVNGNVAHVKAKLSEIRSDDTTIHTRGSGTIAQAAPDRSANNLISSSHIGTVDFNHNRVQAQSDRLNDFVVSGLLTNGYSIYNNGKDAEFPQFFCDSRPADYSKTNVKTIPVQTIKEQKNMTAVPVFDSKRNGNEVIVRNTLLDTENPLLFSNTCVTDTMPYHQHCYSGPLKAN
jgi:hypothetical protein